MTRPNLAPAWIPPQRTATQEAGDTRRIVEGIRHGLTGYIKHSCRCGTCRDADRDNRQKRREKIARDDIPHGTVKGYTYYRCRCTECRNARAEYRQAARIMVPKGILDKAAAQARRDGRNLSDVVTDVLSIYAGVAGDTKRVHASCQTCFCRRARKPTAMAGAGNHRSSLTPEEIALIKSGAPAKEVAAKIGRTTRAVYAMRHILRKNGNLTATRQRHYQPYTSAELEVLASNLPDEEVAKMLNRTVASVHSKRQRAMKAADQAMTNES